MDMVKGIGIFGIVVMHSTTVPLQAIWWISSVATPLFFLSSGMLINHTKEMEKKGKEILIRKSRSLILPFLYFSLLYILRDIFLALVGTSDMTVVWDGIISLITFWGSSVLWFLPALFLAECIFIFLRKKCNMWITAVGCFILTVVSFILNDLLQPLEVFFLSERYYFALLCVIRTVLRAVYGIPFVCAGYFLYEIGKKFGNGEKKVSRTAQLAGGISLFLVGIPLSVMNGYFDFRSLYFGDIPVLAYFSAVISFTGIVFLCKNCRPFKPIIYFGKNSLIIMATHIDFYVLYLALNLANRIDRMIPMWNRVFYFVNVIGAILILEVIFIELINRFLPVLTGRKCRKAG